MQAPAFYFLNYIFYFQAFLLDNLLPQIFPVPSSSPQNSNDHFISSWQKFPVRSRLKVVAHFLYARLSTVKVDKNIPTFLFKTGLFPKSNKKQGFFNFIQGIKLPAHHAFLYEKTHTFLFFLTCINNTIVNYSSNHKPIMVPALAGKSRIYN